MQTSLFPKADSINYRHNVLGQNRFSTTIDSDDGKVIFFTDDKLHIATEKKLVDTLYSFAEQVVNSKDSSQLHKLVDLVISNLQE